jgi:hypothetical protein
VLTEKRSTAKDFHQALSSHMKGSSISHTENDKAAATGGGGGGGGGTKTSDVEEVSHFTVGLFIGGSKSKGVQQQGKEQQNQKSNNNQQSSFCVNVDGESVIAVGTIAKVLDLLQKKKIDMSGIDLVVFYEVNDLWNVDNVSVFTFLILPLLFLLSNIIQLKSKLFQIFSHTKFNKFRYNQWSRHSHMHAQYLKLLIAVME